MKARTGIVIASYLALAGLACGQVHQVALDTFDTDTQGARPTDAALGVNDDDTIVVMTNMRVSLFDKSGGSPLDTWQVGNTANFPFRMFDPTDGRFFDPRVEYDPINDRLWMMYSEDNIALGDDTRARVHIAISKEGEPVDDFSGDNWWYFTGKAGGMSPTVRDGEPFDMGDSGLRRYQNASPGTHDPFDTLVDLPSVGFDERAMIFTPYSAWGAPRDRYLELDPDPPVQPGCHGR